MTTDDMELVRQYAADQSESAFATLVARHANLVYSASLRRVRDPQVAEEITQAVFIILARKAGGLDEKTILPSWLYRAACYTANSALKREYRRQKRELEAYMQSTLREPQTDEAWQQMSPLLEEAMLRLGQTDRDALVLRYFEGRNLTEVGTALGASEEATRKRVHRAVEKLRKFFTRHGVALSGAVIAGAISANSVQAAPSALTQAAAAVAIVKGATASGSTLALIEGALKLMAWTKTKTAILVSTAILLATSAGIVALNAVHSARVASYPDIQGAWEGVMLLDDAGVETGETASTHLVFKISKTMNGYSATSDWIEKGRRDVPMGKVVYDYPSLRIERNPRETWKLAVNTNATEMVLDYAVHFIQPAPVLLKRTTTPDPVPERLAENDFAPRAGSDLQGYWKGAIGNGKDAVPVIVKIAEQADGTFRAEGDDPMRGANGQPGTLTYTRPEVTFTLATGAGKFEGEINRANTEISGSWIQGGQSTPATVKRADYQADHARDTLKSYAFNSENDLEGHWRGSWIVPIAKVKVTIRLALDIAKLPDGTYSTTLVNIDEFGHDDPIPSSDFQYASPRLRLEWKWAGGAYEGKLQNGKLVGTWFQGGGGFPLIFERRAGQ